MTTQYGTYTPIDLLHALQYASDQVAYLRCTDQDMLTELCPEGSAKPCFKWKQNSSFRMYPKPCNITNVPCATDADCKNTPGAPTCSEEKVCSFCPGDAVKTGQCVVADRKTCESLSELPYKCTNAGCDWVKRPSGEKGVNKPYTEWHPQVCGNGYVCANPNQSCVDGKCSCRSDADCGGDGVCTNGKCEGSQCVLGNFLLRQWCEQPISRCLPNKDGVFPPICRGSALAPGIVTVPPFKYDETSGKCYMTYDYCKSRGLRFSRPSCSSQSDCAPGEICEKAIDGTSHCTGETSDCKIPPKNVGEMLVGKTLFSIFELRPCKEPFKATLERVHEKLNQTTSAPQVNVDDSLVKHKTLLKKDFAGAGIHLYMIDWKDELPSIGFLRSELNARYARFLKKVGGRWVLAIRKSDIGDDNGLKRIYGMLTVKNQFSRFLANSINK